MAKNKTTHIADNRLQLTDISWERLFLSFTIHSDYRSPLEFSMSRITFPEDDIANFVRSIPLKPIGTEDDTYIFRLNMSIMDNGSFPANGRWFFTASTPEADVPVICTITYDCAYDLVNQDRIFPYGKSRYAYTAHFSTVCYDDTNIIPALHSHFMIENMNWGDRFVVSERNTLKGKIQCLFSKFKRSLIQKTYNFLTRFRSHDHINVLLMSENKAYLTGNLKGIDDRISERRLEDRIQVTHSLRTTVGSGSSLRSWFSMLRLLAGQDFIFVDDYVPVFAFLRLKEPTKLIQVWHAGVGFKSVGYTRFGKSGSPHPTESCHRHYDYAITGSDELNGIYSELFGLPEEKMLGLGLARSDNLLDEELICARPDTFYKEHPECRGKKLILFAPTFRGKNQKKAYYNYDKLDMDAIYDFCGDEYIWAFKMHPFIRTLPEISEKHSDRIIDLSSSSNINDLYPVADILITDYSSAYYEFSMLGKPLLFYTYDREVYEVVRGVHQSIRESAPGKVCDTFDELMTALENKDYELEKTLKFKEENFSNYDGHAADKIIDKVLLQK